MIHTNSTGPKPLFQFPSATGNHNFSSCTWNRNHTICKTDKPKIAGIHNAKSGLRNTGDVPVTLTLVGGPESLDTNSGSGDSNAGSVAQADHIPSIGGSGQDSSGAVHVQQVQGNTGQSTFFSLDTHTTQTILRGPAGTQVPTSGEVHDPNGVLNTGSNGGGSSQKPNDVAGVDSGSGTINTGPAAKAGAGARGHGTSSDPNSSGGASTGAGANSGSQPASDSNQPGADQPSQSPQSTPSEQEPSVQVGQPPSVVSEAGQPAPVQAPAEQPQHGAPAAGQPATGANGAGNPAPGDGHAPASPVGQGGSGSGSGQPGSDQISSDEPGSVGVSGTGNGATNEGEPGSPILQGAAHPALQQPPQQQITVGGTVLNVIPHATLEAHTTAINLQTKPGSTAVAGPSEGPDNLGNPDQGSGPAESDQGMAPGESQISQGQGENGSGSGNPDFPAGNLEAPAARPGQGAFPDTVAHPVSSSAGGVVAGSSPPSSANPGEDESIASNPPASPDNSTPLPAPAAAASVKLAPPVIITHDNHPVAVQPLAPVVVTSGTKTITQPLRGSNLVTSAGEVFSPLPSSSLSFSTSSGTSIPVAVIPVLPPPPKTSTDAIGNVHTLASPPATPIPLKPAPPAVITTDAAGHRVTSIPGLFGPSNEDGHRDQDIATVIPTPTLPSGVSIQAFHAPALMTITSSTPGSSQSHNIQELIPLPAGESSIQPSIVTISGTPVAVISVEPTLTITTSGSVIEIFPASPLFISHAGTTEAVITVPLASNVATATGRAKEEVSLTTSGTRVFAVVPTPITTATEVGATRTFTASDGKVWVASVGSSTTIPISNQNATAALPSSSLPPLTTLVVSASAGGAGGSSLGNGTTTYAVPSKVSVSGGNSAAATPTTTTTTSNDAGMLSIGSPFGSLLAAAAFAIAMLQPVSFGVM